ncbi:MAG: DUF4157 domain-containing protein [Actinomycetia bacterium]|nr:DUF4157 domain-containing protein [Actinomycetes bacterium]
MTNTLDSDAANEPAAEVAPSPPRRVRARHRQGGSAAHEREADLTADAILRGASAVASGLNRTAAARRPAGRSTGEPLASGLRRDLEHAFGAELDAVRVHTDPAADALSAAEEATAFTAGAHIFFRTGEFEPDSLEGRRLLLHELTHVLQQTARTSATGRPRAVDVSSSGPIQAQDEEPQDFDKTMKEIGELKRWQGVTALHYQANAEFIQKIGAGLGFRIKAKTPGMTKLAARATAGEFGSLGERELSFVYDVLKSAGLFEEAATVVIADSDNKIRTIGESTGVAEVLNKRRNETVTLIDHAAPLQKARQRMLAGTWAFLRNPHRTSRRVSELHWRGNAAPPIYAKPPDAWLSHNERFKYCALTLQKADEWRLRVERASADGAGARATNIVARGLARASELNRLATDQLTNTKLNPQALSVVAEIQRRAAWAQDFWRRAKARREHLMSLSGGIRAGEVDDDTRARLRRAATRPQLRAAVDKVVAAGLAFLGAGPPTTPTAYAKRTADLAKVADEAHARVLPELDRLMRNNRSQRETMAAIDVLVRLEWLSAGARRYIASKDVSKHRDLRRAHFADVALELRRFAIDFGHTELEAAALTHVRSVAIGKRVEAERAAAEQEKLGGGAEGATKVAPGQEPDSKPAAPRDDVLILASDWMEKEKYPSLDKLEDDFGRGIIMRGVTIPIRAITNHYRMRFARAAIKYLDEGLRGEGVGPNEYLVQSALTRAKAIARPRRWSVDDYRWLPFDGDTRSIPSLIRLHDKTQQRVMPTLKRRSGFDAADPEVLDWAVYPYPSRAAGREETPVLPSGVFLWSLPDYAGLEASIVSTIEAFSRAGEIAGAAPGSDTFAAAAAWLGKGTEAEQRAKLVELQTHLYAASAAETAAVYETLGVGADGGGILRRATNRDRAIVRKKVHGHLKKYVDGGKVGAWSHPSKAMEDMAAFGRYALPSKDGIAQMVALILEAAEDINKAFLQESWFDRWLKLGPREEKRFDLVTGYWGLVAMARAWAGDPARRAKLNEPKRKDRAQVILDRSGADIQQISKQFLDPVATSFERTRAEMSKGQGFTLSKKGLRSPNYHATVPLDTALSVETSPGIWETWTIVAASVGDTEIRYQPKWGTQSGPAGAATSFQKAEVFIGESDKPATAGKLFEVRINGETKETIEVGDKRLHALWRAVEEMAFIVAMQNLGEAIEGSIGLALDLAEFIPGAGQALMVGRILASIAMFLNSADFADIRRAVSGEMFKQVEEIGDRLDQLLTPEALWETMLFGDIGGLQALRKIAAKPGRRRKGSMARLMRRIREVGPFLANQAESLEQKVQLPLRNTQSYVQRNPPVAMLVVFAAEALQVVKEIPDPEQLKKDFSAQLEAMVDTVNQIEVPDEIIAPATFVEAIIGLILGRLGTKGKVVREVLHMTGLMSEAAELVADALGNSLDGLNSVWETQVADKIDEKVLKPARTEFVDALNTAFAAVGMADLVTIAAEGPKRESVKNVALGVGDQAEGAADEPATTQPTGPQLDLDHTGAAPILSSSADWSSGRQLSAGLRTDVEHRFGHDFSDVRIHSGSSGAGFTEPFGADAVTSGSHVFLRDGLSLHSTHGRDVLRHELTHVLQQRGPRQIGGPAAAPVRGRPSSSTGLDWDGAAESEADRVAGLTGDADAAPTPVEVDHRAHGLQPKLGAGLTVRILERLADFKELREFQREVAEEDELLSKRKMTPADESKFETLFADIVGHLTPEKLNSKALFPGETDDTELDKAVATHITASVQRVLGTQKKATEPGPNAVRLAKQSLEAKDQTKAQKKSNAPIECVFDARQFVAFVEAYLLVRAGLVVEISWDAPGGKKRSKEPPAKIDITKVELRRLFMGGITRNLKGGLWPMLMERQFKDGNKWKPQYGKTMEAVGKVEAYRPQLTIAATADHKQNVVTEAEFYGALLSEIRRRPPRDSGFVRGKFRLVNEIVERAVDALTATGDAKPELLPPAREYAKPTRAPGASAPGLHLDTHGTLTGPKTPDRESHHTTQFLLSEYFRHAKPKEPFAEGDPGVWMDGKAPKKLFGPSRTVHFDLLAEGGGRGIKMPAILIANTTHRRGKLHINSAPPDEIASGDDPNYGGSRDSQADTLDGWWRKATTTAVEDRKGKPVPEVFTSATPGSKEYAEVTRSRAGHLVDAVDATYSRMRGHMLPALSRALRDHESAYYMALARRKTGKDDDAVPSPFRMTNELLDGAFGLARRKNDETMSTYGFRAR